MIHRKRKDKPARFRRAAALVAVLALFPPAASAEATSAPHPTLEPLQTEEPAVGPVTPERDEEGFLAEDGEWFYEDDEGGVWIYLSPTLQVDIRRYTDRKKPLIWFETDIRTRGEERFRTVMTDPENPGAKYNYPYVIAQNEQFVLAFSDDFYADRMKRNKGDGYTGIIIREGQIISTTTYSKRYNYLPNLAMMIQYPDGRLEVCECYERTAEEMLEAGAINVFSFGPILIRDGEINDQMYNSWYRSIEPRHALGMIEPGHYLLISVQGRRDDSKGTFLQRVAEMMKERGVTQALNLDGGNTMALMFRGRMLNKEAVYQGKKFVRTVPSLIGIGFTETAGP